MRADANDLKRAKRLPADPAATVVPMSPPSDVAPRNRNSSPRPDFALIDWSEIRQPLPPVEYMVDALSLSPGAPTCFGGFGDVKKTITAQSFAVAVASGLDLWGVYRTKAGRVLHVDHEQGQRLTSRRYQRLARGMGIESLDALDGRLKLAALPSLYLSADGAYDAYMRATEGVDLVIVDSLRAAAPDVDENSSEIRRVLDQMTTLSEKSGALYVFIHHASKPKKDDPDDVKYKLRGSGAIFDACASVFVLVGTPSGVTKVHHTKNRERGLHLDPFGLKTVDVAIGDDPRGGLRVEHQEPEQMRDDSDRDSTPAPLAVQAQIRQILHENGGRFNGSKNALCTLIGGRKANVLAALGTMSDVFFGSGAGGSYIAIRGQQ